MIRVLVIANDSHLAAAIASMLTEQSGEGASRLTHHQLEDEELRSMVTIVDEGKPGKESIFYSSLYMTQTGRKRDDVGCFWAFYRI
jgi:hypothetical protein